MDAREETIPFVLMCATLVQRILCYDVGVRVYITQR